MQTTKFCLYSFLFLLLSGTAFSQTKDLYDGGMNIRLGDNDNKQIRFVLLQQYQARIIENNPGTTDANGQLADHSFDIGARRIRATVSSQISSRFLVHIQFGINNQSFVNGGAPGLGPKKPQMFIHDAWTQYAILPEKDDDTGEWNPFSVSMGMGLHFWNGISRMSSASIVSFLTVDLPVFNFPNIEHTDQFARQYGIYAKGKAGRFDYRFHLNNPFVNGSLNNVGNERAINVPSEKLATGGYIAYEFMDREAHKTPYMASTYIGKKKVFNLGAGFYHQPEASGILDGQGNLDRQNHTAWAVDAFLDYPLGANNVALTMYSVLYNYDYGTDYYRSVGIMNLAGGQAVAPANFEGNVSIDGFGNAEPLLGTGSIWMSQAGILLPVTVGKRLGRFQLFGRTELKNLDYLDESAFNQDFGINWFIERHHARITLQYGKRQVFTEQNNRFISNITRGQWTLQSQIYL
jgi:hypothetical protein